MRLVRGLTIAALIALLTAGGPAAGAPAPRSGLLSAADAKQQFERLKALAGRWEGSSTKGWKSNVIIRVIARGSAVMQTSEFQDEPGEGMATVYFLDRGKLMLTHYCEAGNQPTLVAAGMSTDGRQLAFAFQSGTGMTSRDQGHMDSLTMRFASDGGYSGRWTWYANGKESWMEDIRYRRVRDGPTPHGR